MNIAGGMVCPIEPFTKLSTDLHQYLLHSRTTWSFYSVRVASIHTRAHTHIYVYVRALTHSCACWLCVRELFECNAVTSLLVY